MIFYLKTLTAVLSSFALAALAVATIVLSATEESDPRSPAVPRQPPALAAQSDAGCAATCRAD